MAKKSVITIFICLVLIVCTISTAVAWFYEPNKITPNLSGSAVIGYFAGGDGSIDQPYLLTEPIHVYNLAWLQYMGLLNYDDNGNVQQLYFQLNNDINMSEIILPPIGTSDFPFIGHFNGQGYCISNLTVSNYIQGAKEGAEEGIVSRPLSVTDINGDSVSIVGFFGVVGDYDGKLSGFIANDSSIDDITQKVNAVHDLFLDNLTVRTETDKSLIGLFAGYVNGSASNIGIGDSRIVVGDGVMPLTADLGFEMQQIISMYSLIGKYDLANVEWEDNPLGSGGLNDDDNGDTGWGGSMDMYEIIRRATYIYTENIVKARQDKYPVVFYADKYGSYAVNYTYTNATSSKTAYLEKNTFLPINVDTATMFAGNDTVVNSSYLTNDYYSSHSTELIASNNSGYIVGGGSGSSSLIRFRINPLANGSSYPGIYKSIGTAKTASPNFSRQNFEMLTIGTDGVTYVIKDDYNTNASTAVTGTDKSHTLLRLKKYEDVVSSFAATMTDKTMLYALRFFTGSTGSNGIDIDNLKTTIADSPSFFGKTQGYENYEFIDGAINFKVQGAGIITTIAGTYASQSGNHSFFNLIEVQRDSNNKITSARVIEKIWVKYSGDEIVDIQYNDDITNTTGYTIAYDESKMNTLTSINTAYYFELPVKKGDYALGAIKGNSTGAYLMYLDIGSNGDMSFDDPTDEPSTTHSIAGITFVESSYLDATKNDPSNRTTEDYPVTVFEIKLDGNTNTYGLNIHFIPSADDVSTSITTVTTPSGTNTEFGVTKKKKE